MSPETQRLLNIARGCRDYGGGHRSNPEHYEIYQHGIETVIRALEESTKGDNSQLKALEVMGKEASHNGTSTTP